MSVSTMTKQDWVELFVEVGLDEATMRRWHAGFERRWPEDHQRFLEWLNITPGEIQQIRRRAQEARLG